MMEGERMIWLDWMKVLAIFSIIWGHFFSEGHVYLYVFSVQVFCVISGFLYKKASNLIICIKKCFWQLLIPTLVMSLIMHLEDYYRYFKLGIDYDISWTWFIKWLLLGHRWCMGPCWYFYSLIVMRLIMQMLPEKKWVYAILFVVLSVGINYLHYIGFEANNANVNVLVCMPFFLIGVFLKPMKEVLNCFNHHIWGTCLFVISVALVLLCGNSNGYVWMYKNGIGYNYALYILGGMAGTLMLFVASRWLCRIPNRKMILTLSKGSILIIGLHIIVVRRLTDLPNRMWEEDLIFSLFILFAFVPFIRLAEVYFPFILGRYNSHFK